MKRRDFTLISASVAAALILPSLQCSPPLPDPDQQSILPNELAGIWKMEEIKAIGKKYREMNKETDSMAEIKKQLFIDRDGIRYKGPQTASSISLYLSSRIRKDFETGDTVEINGWILSVTEARQCSYLSLLS